jgi:hypothetical protein
MKLLKIVNFERQFTRIDRNIKKGDDVVFWLKRKEELQVKYDNWKKQH